MKRNRITQVSLIVVSMMLLSLLGSGTSIAGDPDADQGPIATVIIEADVVTWKPPQVENGGLVLTIAGPGDWYLRQEYQSGAHPALKAEDGAGNALPDGSYTYELRLVPANVEAPAEYDETQRGIAPTEGDGKALVQSGYFSILSGGFVIPDMAESSAHGEGTELLSPDIVHNDDVIIDGSLCVGNDCSSGLAFGFDTIVLMEDNLRIFFDDTSTIPNHPRNDWRIIMNDSTDGGGNYFAIEDATEVSNILVLEAGAPDNSLYVDSHGDVGLNTSTPYYELHIVDGDSPTVRLEQDASYGWTPQIWDLCGDESSFFIRDATLGSKLPFRIETDAPTDTVFLKSNGHVGIGTGSPGAQLHVEGSDASFRVVNTTSSTTILDLDIDGDLTLAGLLTEASDKALKENFRPVDGQQVLEGIAQLPISTWNFISDGQASQHMGPMAQDFHATFGLGADDRHIASLDANGVALAGVQELHQMLVEREAQIAELQQQNADLEARLAELEALVYALVEAQITPEGQ